MPAQSYSDRRQKPRFGMIVAIVLLAAAMLPSSVLAQSYLIENVRIFNGVDTELRAGHVLVRDGLIDTVTDEAIDAPEGAVVIAGDNRILTPGFIDLHIHGVHDALVDNGDADIDTFFPARLDGSHGHCLGGLHGETLDVDDHLLFGHGR